MGARLYRLPRHVAVIPDGNRRWAAARDLPREAGYAHGIEPGAALCALCADLGIPELTFYGFTLDNTKRPAPQKRAFRQACVDAVLRVADGDASLLVVGNANSPVFPTELLPFTTRRSFGRDRIRVNFLVNYDWRHDLGGYPDAMASAELPRIDLVVRWGGRRRLSGMLPVQSVYADIYVVDALWPDYDSADFLAALDWYQQQDTTFGG